VQVGAGVFWRGARGAKDGEKSFRRLFQGRTVGGKRERKTKRAFGNAKDPGPSPCFSSYLGKAPNKEREGGGRRNCGKPGSEENSRGAAGEGGKEDPQSGSRAIKVEKVEERERRNQRDGFPLNPQRNRSP